MKRLVRYGAALLLAANAASAIASDASANVDLAAAFGAREGVEYAALSPDGTRLAFIAPVAGQGAALYTVDTKADAVPRRSLIANGDPQRLRGCNWVSNRRLVCRIYSVLASRQTDYHIFSQLVAVDAEGGGHVKTIESGVDVIDWLTDAPHTILVTRQDYKDMAVDRVDTDTGRATTDFSETRPYTEKLITDGRGTVRIMQMWHMLGATGMDSGRSTFMYRRPGSHDWETMGEFDAVKGEGFEPEVVDPDQNKAYGLKKAQGRWAAYRMALDGSMALDSVYARSDVDIDGIVTIGRRNRPVGAAYVTDRRHIFYFDPALQKLTVALAKALPGNPMIDIVDSSFDESRLLVLASRDNDPGTYYLYDRSTRQLQRVIDIRPQLAGRTFAKPRHIRYPAADGTMIPAYLTLPSGGGERDLPTIVMPHGGPEARDEGGFDWLVQYFAARGFAVLQPEFRGSSGYGDDWLLEGGFKSWRTAISDICAGGRWMIAQGIASPRRIAIVGWSYGGYAALQSAIADPALFRAVVAVAPVTNLTALKNDAIDWSNHHLLSQFIGDGPNAHAGSPAEHADRIMVPVLMFHGEDDRNVVIEQSRLMDAKLKSAGKPHELVTWPKLDHQLEDSDARALLLRKSDAFLRSTMGM